MADQPLALSVRDVTRDYTRPRTSLTRPGPVVHALRGVSFDVAPASGSASWGSPAAASRPCCGSSPASTAPPPAASWSTAPTSPGCPSAGCGSCASGCSWSSRTRWARSTRVCASATSSPNRWWRKGTRRTGSGWPSCSSGRPAGRGGRALPAPVLRRPAAAHLDRPGARAPSRHPGRRRAGQRAGRLGPRAGPQPHHRPRLRAVPHPGVRLARPVGDPARLRPGRGDARRPGRRDGHDRARSTRTPSTPTPSGWSQPCPPWPRPWPV